jgi:hypothetical protein
MQPESPNELTKQTKLLQFARFDMGMDCLLGI